MESKTAKPFSLFTILVLAIVLGSLAGAAIFQAASQGYLPFKTNLPKISTPLEQKTQTILNEENAVIDVVDKTSSSVVAIGATRKVFNPFDPFSVPRNQSSTIGTGFVVSDKGIIVTNKHVVSDSDTRYTVVTRDGKRFDVQKIYRDPILDLALVQIDGSDFKALELGDSSQLKVGQTVIAIGNALGKFTNTVTTGVVSGLGRRVVAGDPFSGSAESLDDLVQTDAAINPGNSGGPLLNSAGQVIGLNVATTEGAQNIGFAIPINSVKKIVDEFVQKGTVSRPFLGIRYRFISKDLAILNELPQGAYIQEVVENSSASKAGVQTGDIITKVDGQAVDSETKISEVIAGKKTGDRVEMVIWNDGKEKTVTATLQESPNQ
ncbi:MAG: HtrA2 peptidase [Candidatus Daviesbacteria bacterium GW2011_GWA1_41_61]|uniref:HtrA2 peptidase n=1 Tax=Candidatus Daviesbacteria bacterium GW2011_GWA2_40_9 TaxID=1618424 RepID=A0A0G0U7M2_9BACT|nr:MAG: pdz/dhr/glgf [Candidatus Daviesbacteria bacterium GW2011_GWC1_40_9]KKR83201.1 MAG: HtrA2 peptidase [Candidatus Daviesbacteria bacterium GW2011_GWA2_40_9]KKR93547.1 MAG: HtrA2 peptidase [Candidatus Daviesbacteria bacterium GW2011_GWB1_41_15]KKS14902.1 MAG: HtrA2 peptidase [Candidatus Daviesbacteria bacterium GW2011_GWA1_41_61]